MTGPGWSLDYAPHLGFPGVDEPWFVATAGLNPAAQIERTAQEGFASVCDNNLMQRPEREIAAISAALGHTGVGFSSFVFDVTLPPAPWNQDNPRALAEIRERLLRSLDTGVRVGARFITVVALDDGTSADGQATRMAANLAWAAPIARAAGMTLALEPVNPLRLPGVLVTEVGLAAQILEAAGAGGLCLLFDIEHVRFGNGDLIAAWNRVSHLVGLVQISDHGRVEPGAGPGPIVQFLRHIRAQGWRGTIELEHRHSRPDRDGEAASLRLLKELDMQLARE